jgi:hypothetical protein
MTVLVARSVLRIQGHTFYQKTRALLSVFYQFESSTLCLLNLTKYILFVIGRFLLLPVCIRLSEFSIIRIDPGSN